VKTEEEIKDKIIELYKKRQLVGYLKDTEFGFLQALEWVLEE
jgi:hypothetical protein